MTLISEKNHEALLLERQVVREREKVNMWCEVGRDVVLAFTGKSCKKVISVTNLLSAAETAYLSTA